MTVTPTLSAYTGAGHVTFTGSDKENTVKSEGQVRVGEVLSTTVTEKEQKAVLLLRSVAVQFTSVTPMGKEVEAYEHSTGVLPSTLSMAVGAVHEYGAESVLGTSFSVVSLKQP